MATATELFRKNDLEINRANYGTPTTLTNEDLASQGFMNLKSTLVNGGELFYGDVDPKTGQRYERFVQRPVGYNPNPTPVAPTPAQGNIGVTGSDIIGYRADGTPMYNPNSVSADGVYNEASETNDFMKIQTDLFNQQNAELKAETDRLMQGVERDMEAQREAAIAQQAEEKKTEKAVQFKLGQSGTFYGVDRMRKKELANKAELEELLDKKRELLDKISGAYRKDKIAAAQAYIKEMKDLDNEYYKRKREQRQDTIKEYLDLSGEEREERKFAFDQEKFYTGEDRLNRTQALAEEKFTYEVTKDMEEQALENIKRMASSRIPLDQLSDEKILEMEYNAGLEPGTFEAFYSKILDETEYGDTMDSLKMEQLKAQIARTYQLAKGGSGKKTGKTFKVGNMEIEETGDTFTDTVNEMKALRDQGLLTDFGYKERINALMEVGGYQEDERDDLQSMINKAMEGEIAIGQDLEYDNNPASDFGVDLSQSFGSGNFSNTPITERAELLARVGGSTYVYNQLLREGYPKDAVEEAVNTGFFTETGRKIANAFTNFIK